MRDQGIQVKGECVPALGPDLPGQLVTSTVVCGGGDSRELVLESFSFTCHCLDGGNLPLFPGMTGSAESI